MFFVFTFPFQPLQHENLLFSVQGPKQGFQMLGCRSEPQLWERVAVIETDPVAIKTVPVEKVNLGNSSYQNSSHWKRSTNEENITFTIVIETKLIEAVTIETVIDEEEKFITQTQEQMN